MSSLGVALLAVALVGQAMLGDVVVVSLVTAQIAALNVETLGIMALIGIKLDAVAIVCLVMSIGLSFDYIGHIGHAFLHESGGGGGGGGANAGSEGGHGGGGGSKNARRVELSMSAVGVAVFRGAFSTLQVAVGA